MNIERLELYKRIIMNKLKVNLENCYGITKLNYEFDFEKNKSFIIYASNGSMKTSFAKTFKDLSRGTKSKDERYNNKTLREIKDSNNNDIEREEVFVIQSYDSTYFNSSRIETLLLKQEIKNNYDKIFSTIELKKQELIKKLSECSGVINPDKILSYDIVSETNNKNFIHSLEILNLEINDFKENHLSELKYEKIFNDKTEDIINDKNFQKNLSQYLSKYNELISQTDFFKKGIFDHRNADDVLQNLKNNGFFIADHTIFLKGRIEIKTDEELKKMIDEQKEKVLNNEELKKAFTKVENALNKNPQTREFLSYIKANQTILDKLDNIPLFKRKLWLSYLLKNESHYNELLNSYKQNKNELDGIIQQIATDESDWKIAINKFNQRFVVPFTMEIRNKEDIILNKETPNVEFNFFDKGNKISYNQNDKKGMETMVDILSQGEKRALYLLNIIFEIEARRKLNQKTLFIIDDIADSFDYQNKYAIIEYLNEIQEENKFYQIILTHNYDFFRTINKRIKESIPLQVLKDKNEIKIVPAMSDNIFLEWRNNVGKIDILFVLIPFIRNLIEYTTSSKTQNIDITSFLHIKDNTNNYTIKDLLDLIQKINYININDLQALDNDKKYLVELYDNANTITKKETIYDKIKEELKDKIILSIAIRLKTEEFLIEEIKKNDSNWKNDIKNNQTVELIKQWKKINKNPQNEIIINKVNLMTPENIHLNSFMYEPIIDICSRKLKELYQNVCSLTTSKSSQINLFPS